MSRPTKFKAWISAVVIALVLGSSHHLDTAQQHLRTEWATAQAKADALKESQRRARFERAAALMCSGNGSYVMENETTIRCTTHKGRRTNVVYAKAEVPL